MASNPALVLHRFGVGARPGELSKVPGDAKEALATELRKPQLALVEADGLPHSSTALVALASARMEKRDLKAAGNAVETKRPAENADMATALASGDPGLVRRTIYRAEVMARLKHGATTDAGFLERLVLFWTNHFAVSAAKGNVRVLAGAMEREAIRPHVLGPFADMLKAVEQHPAMLIFLDNQGSIGPNSRAGLRGGKGLNENLAREALELHTLGADAGYTQDDVTSFAKALTGWSLRPPNSGKPNAGSFTFFPEGTDHGTAAASFLVGGAVNGGRVLADWPSLKSASLYEGRDLMPTTDLRGLLKGVLKDHLGFPDGVLARDVFPGSKNVSAIAGLIA